MSQSIQSVAPTAAIINSANIFRIIRILEKNNYIFRIILLFYFYNFRITCPALPELHATSVCHELKSTDVITDFFCMRLIPARFLKFDLSLQLPAELNWNNFILYDKIFIVQKVGLVGTL